MDDLNYEVFMAFFIFKSSQCTVHYTLRVLQVTVLSYLFKMSNLHTVPDAIVFKVVFEVIHASSFNFLFNTSVNFLTVYPGTVLSEILLHINTM